MTSKSANRADLSVKTRLKQNNSDTGNMFAHLFFCGYRELLLRAAGSSLAALVVLVGIQPIGAQTTAVFFDYPGTSLNGVVSAQVIAPLQACRSLCTSRSGCVGFDHSSADNSCRLLAGVSSAGESRASTAATRNLIIGYRPPSNPPATPSAAQPKVSRAAPPNISGRKVSYRSIPGDPRPIGWVYINVCSGAPVEADSLRSSINGFVFESLRLIPGRIEQFDRSTTPQCALVPKAVGYASPGAEEWRIGAALEEMRPLLRPAGVGTRADGLLPMQGSDRYRIDIWLGHE
ncbi:PAN domain-containing protein [Mesorhizobium sp. WSM4308]|uniref:PAN domain-containing protein n=2 Tax=Mesorhizobium TaxID=68287 RepID=UPI0032AEB0A9